MVARRTRSVARLRVQMRLLALLCLHARLIYDQATSYNYQDTQYRSFSAQTALVHPASLQGELVMEPRGGYIDHSADIYISIVECSGPDVNLGPPEVGTLTPSLGHSRLRNHTYRMHFGVPRS